MRFIEVIEEKPNKYYRCKVNGLWHFPTNMTRKQVEKYLKKNIPGAIVRFKKED